MIRPLNQIGLAIAHFSQDLSLQPLPTERGDELGKLARDIRAMQEKILAQIIQLNTNVALICDAVFWLRNGQS